MEDIHEVLKHFHLKHAIEVGTTYTPTRLVEGGVLAERAGVCVQPYKRYPRDSLVLGRVKVELKGADGTPKHPELPTRK